MKIIKNNLEKDIENYLVRQCKKNNILCYKFVSPSQNGVPDRILIANNKTIFVELKKPGEKPRKLQQYVFEQMIEHGAILYVIDNKKDINKLIKKILR